MRGIETGIFLGDMQGSMTAKLSSEKIPADVQPFKPDGHPVVVSELAAACFSLSLALTGARMYGPPDGYQASSPPIHDRTIVISGVPFLPGHISGEVEFVPEEKGPVSSELVRIIPPDEKLIQQRNEAGRYIGVSTGLATVTATIAAGRRLAGSAKRSLR